MNPQIKAAAQAAAAGFTTASGVLWSLAISRASRPGTSAALSHAAAACTSLAGVSGLVALDPADPHYGSAPRVQPLVIRLEPLEEGNPLAAVTTPLVVSLRDARSFMAPSLRAWERALGAAEARDNAIAERRLAEATTYAHASAAGLRPTARWLGALAADDGGAVSAMADEGGDEALPDTVLVRVVRSGLDIAEVDSSYRTAWRAHKRLHPDQARALLGDASEAIDGFGEALEVWLPRMIDLGVGQ